MPPELAQVPQPEPPPDRRKGVLNAISASTHVPIGWIVTLIAMAAALVGMSVPLAFGAGTKSSEFEQNRKDIQEAFVQIGKLGTRVDETNKSVSEQMGVSIQVRTELRFIRENQDDFKKTFNERMDALLRSRR